MPEELLQEFERVKGKPKGYKTYGTTKQSNLRGRTRILASLICPGAYLRLHKLNKRRKPENAEMSSLPLILKFEICSGGIY